MSKYTGIDFEPVDTFDPVEEDRRYKELQLRSNVGQSDPEHDAKIYGLAEETDNAPDYVRENLKLVESQKRTQDIDYESLVKKNPVITRVMGDDPGFAQSVSDDIDNLTYWERFGRNTSQAWNTNERVVEESQIGYREMFGQASEVELIRRDELQQITSENTDYDLGWTNWVSESLGQVPFMLNTISGGVTEFTTGIAAGAGLGAMGGGVGAVPGAIVGGYAGWTAASINESFKLESGLAWNEFSAMKDENGMPMDKNAARAAAIVVGTANGLAEGVPMSKAFKNIPGVSEALEKFTTGNMRRLLQVPSVREALKNVTVKTGGVAVAEAVTEAVQEINNVMGGNVLAWLSEGDFETTGFKEGAHRVGESFAAGAGAGVVMNAPATAITIAEDTVNIVEARRRRDAFLEMGRMSSESKTRQRLPKKFQKIIADIQEEYGLVEEVHVSAERIKTFFQEAGVTPEEMVKDMPVLSERLSEADALEVDVAIPIDEFATYIAPSKAFTELAGDLRYHPNMPTFNEQQAKYDEVVSGYEELAGRHEKALESAEPIYEQVKGDLLSTGKYSEAEADKMARFEQNTWTTLATRVNADPVEFYQKHNISRGAEGAVEPGGKAADPLASSIDAIRAGKYPTEKEMYGETIIEFIRGKGGLQDQGGELAAIDAGGTGGIVRKNGMMLSELVDKLRDNNYGVYDENQILDLIRDEMGGNPTYSPGNENQEAITRHDSLVNLAEELERNEIDVDATSTEDIMANIRSQDQVEYLAAIEKGLDMSQEARYARAEAMGFDTDTEYYHASTHVIEAFDASLTNPESDFGKGIYLTNTAEDASENYAGEGPDLTQRIELESERISQELEDDFYFAEEAGYTQEQFDADPEAVSTELARKRLVGDATQGTTYPLFIRKEKMVEIGGYNETIIESTDFREEAEGDIDRADYNEEYDYDEAVQERVYELANDDYDHPLIKIREALEELDVTVDGLEDLYFEDGVSATDIDSIIRNSDIYAETPEGEIMSAGYVSAKAFEALGYEGVIDNTVDVKFGPQRRNGQSMAGMDYDTQHVIVFEGYENNIRSINAAFDPDFSESTNILYQGGETLDQKFSNKHPNLDIFVYEGNGVITLSKIVVPEGERGEGQGTAFMEDLISYADSTGQKIALTPDATYGGNKNKLKKFYKSFGFVANKGSNRDFSTKEDMIYEPNTELYQENRGKLEFAADPAKRSWFRMTFTKKANLSTFFHESGHLYYEVISGIAEQSDAPASIVNDVKVIREWLGAKDRELTTEQHEKFARGFESYIMEGKAPTSELRDVFRTFKNWMVRVYSDIKNLNVEINDDVRGVFDRLLASDEAIEMSAKESEIMPVLQEYLTGDALTEYMDAYNQAIDGAKEEVDKKAVAEIVRSKNKEQREARAGMRKVFEDAWSVRPDVTAREELATKGGLKLSSGALRSIFPMGDVEKRLTGLHSKQGVDLDSAALQLGYETGLDLVNALLAKPQKKAWIDYQVDQAMKAKYGDMMTDGSFEAEVEAAVHGESVSRFLAIELKALGGRAMPVRLLKRAAKDHINGLTLATLKPAKYRAAEVRHARQATKALSEGNLTLAAEHKQKQLVNQYMYREAVKARAEISSIRGRLGKYSKKSVRQALGKASGGDYSYLDAIDSLLEGVSLRKAVSLKAISKRGKLNEWIAKQEELDIPVAISADLQEEAALISYKSMTVDELRDLDDAVKNIAFLAGKKNKLLINDKRRKITEISDGIRTNMEANMSPRKDGKMHNKTNWEKKKKWSQSLNAALTKVEFLALWADGGKPGFVHETFFQPFVDAQAKEYDMLKEFGEPIIKTIQNMPREQRARLRQQIHPPFSAKPMYGHEVVAIALNLGNEGNRNKLLKGYGWNEAEVEQFVMGYLKKEDWDLVQELWDGIDKFWPEIEALHKRNTGVAPPRVEAVPIHTPHGVYRGGYYPSVADPTKSQLGEKIADTEALMNGNRMMAYVGSGFTKSRNESFYPIKLSLDVIPKHITEVVHYLSHYEAVDNTRQLLGDQRIKESIKEYFGEEYYQSMKNWLKELSNSRQVPDNYTAVDGFFHHLRVGTSIFAMGFNYWTGIAQTLGLMTAADEIGGRYVVQGLVSLMRNPVKNWKSVNKESGEMRHMTKTFDREVRTALDDLMSVGMVGGFSKAHGQMTKAAFMHIAYIQKSVNIATWLGAKQKFMNNNPGADNQDAINYADTVVRTTQSGGGVKDLAGVQRGSEGVRLISMFYTYFSVLYNRQRVMARTGKKAMKGSITDMAKFTAQFTWLIAMPVIVESLMKGTMPEDEDEYAEWFFQQSLLYGTTSLPWVRDVANGVMTEYGYSFTPAESGISALVRLAKKGSDGEIDTKSLIKTIGVFGKVPIKQPYKMLEYYSDGDVQEPIREFIIGVNKKD